LEKVFKRSTRSRGPAGPGLDFSSPGKGKSQSKKKEVGALGSTAASIFSCTSVPVAPLVRGHNSAKMFEALPLVKGDKKLIFIAAGSGAERGLGHVKCGMYRPVFCVP
jgi:hypothetical protein